ncbi:MAG: Stp1/IreP family PP2C-type Ser/Thr phosphatase [Deltaproteobacteria bacterium]|nr:Stp1/IreP family PP2C-type Ser/Thr phosphatase [Deltaproteobacteria bacterium]
MKISAAGLSDVGLKREGNEDYLAMDNSTQLYIVADGMGGHLAGEVASKIAVHIIQKNVNNWINKNSPVTEIFDFPDMTLSQRGNYLSSSMKLANRVIYEMSQEYTEYKGMGTTIVILAIMPTTIIAANVGDSRIYLIRGDSIEPLSKEHSMVAEQLEMGLISEEEAKISPLRHILTRNLGSSDTVDADIFEIEHIDNDGFLLCTDGLTDLVSDNEIQNIINNGNDPEHICQQLISEANKRGGNDNITVSLICLKKESNVKRGIINKFHTFFKNKK